MVISMLPISKKKKPGIEPIIYNREASGETNINLKYFCKYYRFLTPTYLEGLKKKKKVLGHHTFWTLKFRPDLDKGWRILDHQMHYGRPMLKLTRKRSGRTSRSIVQWLSLEDFIEIEPAKAVYYVYDNELFFEDEEWEEVNDHFDLVKSFEIDHLGSPRVLDCTGRKYTSVYINRAQMAIKGDESDESDDDVDQAVAAYCRKRLYEKPQTDGKKSRGIRIGSSKKMMTKRKVKELLAEDLLDDSDDDEDKKMPAQIWPAKKKKKRARIFIDDI